MPTIQVKDAGGTPIYLQVASGSGTSGSPYVLQDSIPTGSNAIGSVSIDSSQTVGLDAGSASIGTLGANSGVDIGDVDITSIAAGDNNIGNVDIASAIPAGTNAIGKLAANSGVDIGDVDVTSLPALAAGTNAIGKLSANSGVDIGDVDVTSIAAGQTIGLEAGSAAIGKLAANSGVDIGDVTLTAGSASIGTLGANSGVDIGDVDVTSLPALVAGTADVGNVGTKNLTTIATGERQGSASAVQLPTVSCSLVRIKAVNSNAGNVYVGISGVTKPHGTTDTTTGLELDAGEDTGWLPTDNVNRFYIICDNAGDDITYMAMT